MGAKLKTNSKLDSKELVGLTPFSSIIYARPALRAQPQQPILCHILDRDIIPTPELELAVMMIPLLTDTAVPYLSHKFVLRLVPAKLSVII